MDVPLAGRAERTGGGDQKAVAISQGNVAEGFDQSRPGDYPGCFGDLGRARMSRSSQSLTLIAIGVGLNALTAEISWGQADRATVMSSSTSIAIVEPAGWGGS